MDDLISRQAAINAPVRMVSDGIEWIPVYHVEQLPSAQPDDEEANYWHEKANGYEQTLIKLSQNIAKQPQRMKGKWMRRNIKGIPYCCSVCSGRFDYEWKFCPNCGSEMRGEK